MKNSFKHTIALLFVSSFAFTSCLDLTSNATDAEASLRETVDRNINIELPLMRCDFDGRKTTNIVKDKEGYVKLFRRATDTEGPLYLIYVNNEGVRYTACNMPESIMKDGMEITFSGEEKEMMDNEKWLATPLKLTHIRGFDGPRDEPKDGEMHTSWVE